MRCTDKNIKNLDEMDELLLLPKECRGVETIMKSRSLVLSVYLTLINSIRDTNNVLSDYKLLNKAIRSRWLSVATS